MLVLSRKRTEIIKIGDDIEVHVTRIGPNTVRLGIVAPGKRIIRAELENSQPEVSASSD